MNFRWFWACCNVSRNNWKHRFLTIFLTNIHNLIPPRRTAHVTHVEAHCRATLHPTASFSCLPKRQCGFETVWNPFKVVGIGPNYLPKILKKSFFVIFWWSKIVENEVGGPKSDPTHPTQSKRGTCSAIRSAIRTHTPQRKGLLQRRSAPCGLARSDMAPALQVLPRQKIDSKSFRMI